MFDKVNLELDRQIKLSFLGFLGHLSSQNPETALEILLKILLILVSTYYKCRPNSKEQLRLPGK